MLRARSQGVSRWCGCPAFAPLPAFSNVRRIQTLFVGYRHLNRQQIEMTGGGLRVGAVCPPRAPPECFSWFYFACALFAGSGKSGQIAPFLCVCWLRPQMLEKHQSPKKKSPHGLLLRLISIYNSVKSVPLCLLFRVKFFDPTIAS